MVNLEVVSDDADVEQMYCSYDEKNIFLQQTITGHKSVEFVLTKAMAAQTIAALSAFIAGPEPHKSDCALYNSPAYPIGACDCRPR